MPIKAIVFDCGGVVLRDRDESHYARWEARLGLPAGELRRVLYQGPHWAQAEVGNLSEVAYWHSVGNELGLSAEESDRLADDLWASWGVDPIVMALVDQARARFRVAMLSNATDALESKLNGFGVADRFDPIINSARCGVAKPDEAIYRSLLTSLEMDPGDIVFIDDRAENITAAAAMGIHVIWFVNPAELERQLTPYLHPETILSEPA